MFVAFSDFVFLLLFLRVCCFCFCFVFVFYLFLFKGGLKERPSKSVALGLLCLPQCSNRTRLAIIAPACGGLLFPDHLRGHRHLRSHPVGIERPGPKGAGPEEAFVASNSRENSPITSFSVSGSWQGFSVLTTLDLSIDFLHCSVALQLSVRPLRVLTSKKNLCHRDGIPTAANQIG